MVSPDSRGFKVLSGICDKLKFMLDRFDSVQAKIGRKEEKVAGYWLLVA